MKHFLVFIFLFTAIFSKEVVLPENYIVYTKNMQVSNNPESLQFGFESKALPIINHYKGKDAGYDYLKAKLLNR
jgi:hypothetical protein